ncbi:MAG: aldehyde:ferredoxin oxidoreductase, partial [Synergistales bacterium]|nr:aldehyde:ferredoxin oxidoreductase [Synergistales bacterium]
GVSDIEAIIRADELCNLLGLDTISTASVIQWAMECFDRGVLKPEDAGGLELRFGNAEAMLTAIERIVQRKDLGALLAEGVKVASEELGHDSYKWAIQAKGLEQSRVETRSANAYALAFAVNPRGPDHLHAQPIAEFGIKAGAKELIRKITGDEKYATPYITEKRAEIVRWHEDVYAATDSLGFCTFTSTSLYDVTPERMASMFSAFTGHQIGERELLTAGRRIVTLERCFNVREGLDRSYDTLPWRLMNERLPDRDDAEAINSPERLGRMLDEYYGLHGWSVSTGIPKRSTLDALGLSVIAEDLERCGIRLED